MVESRLSGNIELDINADWIDYEAAGVGNEQELIARAVELLRRVDLDEDAYGFGLRGKVDPKKHADIAERLLEARSSLARRLVEENITHLVEPFDPERYNSNASVAENLLFGTPVGPAFDFDQLAQNTVVLRVLDKVGLTNDLAVMGAEVAQTMIELFADLPPDHQFFEQYSFISAGDLPEFQAILARAGKAGPSSLKPDDRAKLLSLPFKLVSARHRLGLLDEAFMQRILEARKVFAADLPPAMRPQIEFFDQARYNAAATVQDNVLFGKVAYGEAAAPTRIPAVITGVLDALGLRDTIIAIGLEFAVGSSGSRLSLGQTPEGGAGAGAPEAARHRHPRRGDDGARCADPGQGDGGHQAGAQRPGHHLGPAPRRPRPSIRPCSCHVRRPSCRAGYFRGARQAGDDAAQAHRSRMSEKSNERSGRGR